MLNLIRMDTTEKVKASMHQKRKRAAWDNGIRMAMLGIKPVYDVRVRRFFVLKINYRQTGTKGAAGACKWKKNT